MIRIKIRICSVCKKDCEDVPFVRGMCVRHYHNWLYKNDPTYRKAAMLHNRVKNKTRHHRRRYEGECVKCGGVPVLEVRYGEGDVVFESRNLIYCVRHLMQHRELKKRKKVREGLDRT